MKIYFWVFVCLVAVSTQTAVAQPTSNNSNYWPVYRDASNGFRISYPSTWLVVKPKGPNVRFSVNPPDGPGNCNVVARYNSELNGISQSQLNQEIESLPQDSKSWAEYVGFPQPQIKVTESKIAKIANISTLSGVVEAKLENLEGKFTRKQMVALAFTPGVLWSLNCGASSFDANESRSRYNTLEPYFKKIFGSFVFTE